MSQRGLNFCNLCLDPFGCQWISRNGKYNEFHLQWHFGHMICILSGRGLSVDIGQFLCWEAMCLSSVWQLMFWILDRAVNMAFPQGSFLPMTLTAHCKFVTLTSFDRRWIVVVVLTVTTGYNTAVGFTDRVPVPVLSFKPVNHTALM